MGLVLRRRPGRLRAAMVMATLAIAARGFAGEAIHGVVPPYRVLVEDAALAGGAK